MSATGSYEALLRAYGLEVLEQERAFVQETYHHHIAFASAVSSLAAARLLRGALESHAAIMEAAAHAARAHATSLARATWALVGATVALVLVALLPLVI